MLLDVQEPCHGSLQMNDTNRHNQPVQPPAMVDQSIFRIPSPVIALITLLVAVQLVPPLLMVNWEPVSLFFFAFIPARVSGEVAVAQVPGSGYWTMLTYGLLHGGWFHLLTNCLWLAVFGTPVARCLGGLKFFLLTALATVAGALASLIVHWGEYVVMVGASGAVSGMLGASVPIMYAPGAAERFRTEAPAEQYSILSFSSLLQNYRALWFMAIWLFFTFMTGATQLIVPTALLEGRQIAWEAHLGGFLAGFAAVYGLAQKRVSLANQL
jgi:membrane associated rhomboid family serine protease